MPLQFDQPALLWLGLLALPLIVVGWRALAGMDRVRRLLTLLLRAALLLALAAILAGPRAIREHDQLTVIGLLDVSGSVRRFARFPDESAAPETGADDADDGAPLSPIEHLRQWLRLATAEKPPRDQFGLVVFDGSATAISTPTTGRYLDDNLDLTREEGTDIAQAIRLGLAMFPPQTARRLLLISDGNQTAGDALAAARGAAFTAPPTSQPDAAELPSPSASRAVPIDVATIDYHVTRDVQVVRVEAPPTARPGQVVTVRVVLDATEPTAGTLSLLREGELVDLSGGDGGGSAIRARPLTIPAGQSVHLAQVRLLDTPVNRFQAVWEPRAAEDDALPDNNAAATFTTTPGKGHVLIVDRLAGQRRGLLERLLSATDLPVRAAPPSALPHDPVAMQAFDLIVLDNIPASELSPQQQDLLARYVHDQGGGLIMIGGPDSLGAGGWNSTAVEAVLPVELDPPKELRLPSAALVLVLDKSGSMAHAVAGARATQQQIANEGAALAIESLRAESLVGVIAFDFNPHVQVPLRRNDDPRAIANQVRGIMPEGGTAIEPALERAHEMLRAVKVEKKRVVLMTDGRAPKRRLDEIVAAMAADGIRVTTIAVGDDADVATLEQIATATQGQFYEVRNPATLPRVLIDSVQVINKPLIKEGDFQPVVQPTGSTLTLEMASAPPLGGLVMTAAKSEPRVVMEMTHPDHEPLLAHWQVGLGRSAVFTSELDGPWSRHWVDWPGAASFWVQLARMIARPAMSSDAELLAWIVDGRLMMTLEANADDQGFLDYLQVSGSVYGPDGRVTPVRLRQTAPGRYEGSVAAPLAGNYVVALNPRRGEQQLPPVIGGASQPTGAEFRRYQSNPALMEQIRQLSGGRRLVVTRTMPVNLFDRAGMPRSISAMPIWQWVLWAALTLLLLDVASRRLAWSWAGVRAAARTMLRLAPAPTRADEAAVTLAGLRQVSARVDQSLAADRGRATEPQAEQRGVQVPADRAALARELDAARVKPDAGRIAAALDALRRRREEPAGPSPGKDVAAAPASADTDAAAQTTRQLLAARRRARGQHEPPPNP